jgi:hypothetical protein
MRADVKRVALAAFVGCNCASCDEPIAVSVQQPRAAAALGRGLRFGIAALLLVGLWSCSAWRSARAGARRNDALRRAELRPAVGLAYYAFVTSTQVSADRLRARAARALLLALLQGQERIHCPAIIGGDVALGGVAVLSEAQLRADVPLLRCSPLGVA